MHGSDSRIALSLPPPVACLAAGAFVGLAAALLTLDLSFIAGTGGKWLRPENDFMSYVVAWRYYVADDWRFPLFSLPAMGFPEGGSVLFTDALPLSALASKIVYRLSGALVNPFGWWILVAHVLQGLMAARWLLAVGVRSVVACATGATLVVCSTSFITRMGHVALSSHFLILWALALYFVMVRGRRARLGELTLLLVTALLVNSYLFAMTAALGATALVTLWWTQDLRGRELSVAAAGAIGVLIVGVIAGYGIMFTNPTLMRSQGFGLYSWNLATLLLPPGGFLGVLGDVPRDATGGQYEGDAYVGHGVLLVSVLAAAWAPGRVLHLARRFWPLGVVLLACAVYAASNRVYAGGRLLLAYDLPQTLLDLGNYFRATGRFIWPLAYCLAILPLACLFRWWRPAPAAAVAVAAICLQIAGSRQILQTRRESSFTPYVDMIGDARIGQWVSSHQRLWMYPSWSCGGLGPAGRRWGDPEANRELQVQFLAARANVPNNSVYTSRQLKDCTAEAAWARAPVLQPGVFYLIALDAIQGSPALSVLARSGSCTTLSWALACSLEWPSERGLAQAPETPEARLQARGRFSGLVTIIVDADMAQLSRVPGTPTGAETR